MANNKPASQAVLLMRESRARKDAKKNASLRTEGKEKWLPVEEWWHFEINRMMDAIAEKEGRLTPKSVKKFRDSGLEFIRETVYHGPSSTPGD